MFGGLNLIARPQRRYTNQLLNSEELNRAAWTRLASSIVYDGTFSEITEDGTNAVHGATQTLADDGYAGTRTLSGFLKAGTRSWGILAATYGVAGADFAAAWFDLGGGVVGTAASSPAGATSAIVNIGGGIYRCSVTMSTTLAVACTVAAATGDTVTNYAGNNGDLALYAGGIMLERGASAGAYYRS